jgi:hypothetical protein
MNCTLKAVDDGAMKRERGGKQRKRKNNLNK